MSVPAVTRLYPRFEPGVTLHRLYLADRLLPPPGSDRAFIYTNFVSSIDGRVSVSDDSVVRGVPSALANRNDWRLYQELAAQADVVITSGRYVREKADGTAGPLLTFPDDPEMADIMLWRRETIGTRVPDVAVVSRSLDFDLDAASGIGGDVVALGSASCIPSRVRELEDAGVTVVLGASAEGLTGMEIATGLHRAGYRTAFSAAGPALAHTLIADGALDRLFVTEVLEILGGRNYVTLNEGSLLAEPLTMELRSLLFDPGGEGPAQLFAAYDAAL